MREFAKLGVLLGVLGLLGCGSAARQVADARPPANAPPTGTLYLANSSPGQLTVVHVAQRRVETRKLRELSPGDPPYMIAVLGQRLVLYGHESTYALDLDLRQPARSLGESWFFVPSATAGRVWLAVLDKRSPATVRALRGVREVTVAGKSTVGRSARPPAWPVAAVERGLVLQQDNTLELWDPATGRILRKLPGVFPLATRDSRVVSCAPGCSVLYLSDTQTGRRIRIQPGRDFRFVGSYNGAFSPDGKFVAVPAIKRRGKPRVALVDLARGVATLVPGVPLARGYQLMTWSSNGWLFYNAGSGRIAAYHPGNAKATVLAPHVKPFVAIAAR